MIAGMIAVILVAGAGMAGEEEAGEAVMIVITGPVNLAVEEAGEAETATLDPALGIGCVGNVEQTCLPARMLASAARLPNRMTPSPLAVAVVVFQVTGVGGGRI